MKRPLAVTLIIGVVVAGLVVTLHGIGLLAIIEQPIAGLVSHFRPISSPSGEVWQYLLIALVFSLGVAALTSMSARRSRMMWVAGALLIEIIVLTAVCALYHIFFQPLPLILAVILAFVAAERAVALATHGRASQAHAFFTGRLSNEQIQRIIEGETPLDGQAKTYEVTVVVCDIANKYDLAEESEPTAFAEAIGQIYWSRD